jgi:hypothetical protein
MDGNERKNSAPGRMIRLRIVDRYFSNFSARTPGIEPPFSLIWRAIFNMVQGDLRIEEGEEDDEQGRGR